MGMSENEVPFFDLRRTLNKGKKGTSFWDIPVPTLIWFAIRTCCWKDHLPCRVWDLWHPHHHAGDSSSLPRFFWCIQSTPTEPTPWKQSNVFTLPFLLILRLPKLLQAHRHLKGCPGAKAWPKRRRPKSKVCRNHLTWSTLMLGCDNWLRNQIFKPVVITLELIDDFWMNLRMKKHLGAQTPILSASESDHQRGVARAGGKI